MPIEANFSAVGGQYQPEVEFITKTINRKKVVIFGKPWQTDSRMAKYIFDQVGEKYYAVEIDTLDNEVELEQVLYKATGHSLLPYIFVNGKYIGSRHELMEIDQLDQLKPLLGQEVPAEAKVKTN